MAWFSLLQPDVARTWKNAVREYTGEGLGDLVHMGTSSGHTGVGTCTLFFFFIHPIIPFSNSFLDFPFFFEYLLFILITLHDLGTYAALSAWLG